MNSDDIRNVAVVGATGTIGRAVCRRLVDQGVSVLGTGRDAESLEELGDLGVRALPLHLSPATASSANFRDACGAFFSGRLDGLVLAGGEHGPIGPTRTLDSGAVAAYLNEHLVSSVALISASAEFLDRGVSPSVILLSGGGATGPRPNYSPYSVAKVGAVRMVENLAIEEPGWRVNAVAPGFIASKLHESSIVAGERLSGERPDDLRRRLAQADSPDIAARLICFLLSEAAAGISGRLISAIWDPWEDPEWRQEVAQSGSWGRLRRVDGMQFVETEQP